MFRFAAIETLFGLVLVPALAAFFWLALRARRQALARFGDLDLVRKLSLTVSARSRVAGRVVASQRAEASAAYVTRTEALQVIETSRQGLHDQRLDIVRAMGGANRRLPEAGRQGAELLRLAQTIETSRAA